LLLGGSLRVDHTGAGRRRGCAASRLAFAAVQRNWIIMQIVVVVLVAAGMIIAASKLWF
jgi:hypothetical protein